MTGLDGMAKTKVIYPNDKEKCWVCSECSPPCVMSAEMFPIDKPRPLGCPKEITDEDELRLFALCKLAFELTGGTPPTETTPDIQASQFRLVKEVIK